MYFVQSSESTIPYVNPSVRKAFCTITEVNMRSLRYRNLLFKNTAHFIILTASFSA